MKNHLQHRSFTLDTEDRTQLFAQEWKSNQSDCPIPVGVIGIVHGLGEHSGRYQSVAEYFVNHGYHVVSYDHRGHGKTGGKMPAFDVLQNDIHALCRYAENNHQLPLVLYGQSLGGALVLKFISGSVPNNLSCAVASSPLLTPTHSPPQWKVTLGQTLLPWIPYFRMAHGLKANDLTHDRAIVEQFLQDPLIGKKVSIALGASMLQSGRELLDRPPNYTIPLLLMHGSSDNITSCESTRRFAAQLSPNCQLKVWDQLFHELHFETNATEVLNFAAAFISSALSRQSSPL